jgi:Na+/proline symporter
LALGVTPDIMLPVRCVCWPLQVYNNLHIISEHRPVDHNKEGSFLTMWSMEGLVFGIINVIGNFGTVFVDQAYCESRGNT